MRARTDTSKVVVPASTGSRQALHLRPDDSTLAPSPKVAASKPPESSFAPAATTPSPTPAPAAVPPAPVVEGQGQDLYGFGFYKSTHKGHAVTAPRPNGLPDVVLPDTDQPNAEQLADITRQLRALRPQVEKLVQDNLIAKGYRSPYDREVTFKTSSGVRTVNLARTPAGTLTPDEMSAALEALLKVHTFTQVKASVAKMYGVQVPEGASTVDVPGEAALRTMLKVVDDTFALAAQGPDVGPELPQDPVRCEELRAAVRNWVVRNLWHSLDNTFTHLARGYDFEKSPQLNETLGHDNFEFASIKRWFQIDPNGPKAKWAERWLREAIGEQGGDLAGVDTPEQLTEAINAHPEWTFNPNAGDPRYLLAMYYWGDAREDDNSSMGPHRTMNHHDGDVVSGFIDLGQKIANVPKHHGGLEQWGIRHMMSRGYDLNEEGDYQRAVLTLIADPAVKSFIRQQAVADLVLQRVLQECGFLTPEQMQKTVNPALYDRLDPAYQQLQAIDVKADSALTQLRPKLKGLSFELEGIRSAIDWLSDETSTAQARLTLTEMAAKLTTLVADSKGSAKHYEQLGNLASYAMAQAQQLAPRSVEALNALWPLAATFDALAAKAFARVPDGLTLYKPAAMAPLEKLTAMRETLNALPQAAQESRANGDVMGAAVYERWNELLSRGFPSQYH